MAPREMFPSPVPKYPSYRDDPLKSPSLWLKGKQKDDGAEGLWRVHDDLYDLTSWIRNHPGGADWLILTKGTDITEAFESHHISSTASHLLEHFKVRRATTPRNSPYTFHENGFYRTLKRKVMKELNYRNPGASRRSQFVIDMLCCSAIITSLISAAYHSYIMGIFSGFLLACTVIAAHNFFHLKDNFRMFYFDLSLMSSRDWRISHVLSHHLYPNSLLDLELSLFEPIFRFLPDPSKSWWARYGPWVYSPFIYSAMFLGQRLTRILLVFRGHNVGLTKEDAIGLILPTLMYLTGCGLWNVITMWLWIIVVASFFFGVISLNGAHHHPEIFHDGDAPRTDRDFGLAQLDTVRDRPAVCGNLLLALTNFGHHCLHHMFPSIDHDHLSKLYPIFRKTCTEFDVHFHEHSVMELFKGQYQQIARNEPNPVPPGTSKGHGSTF